MAGICFQPDRSAVRTYNSGNGFECHTLAAAGRTEDAQASASGLKSSLQSKASELFSDPNLKKTI